MNVKKEEMIEAIESLSAISEEYAAATQEVLASVELQTNSISEITVPANPWPAGIGAQMR